MAGERNGGAHGEPERSTARLRAYAQAVYGGHPYGREVTQETLAAIGVDHMRALHSRMLLACRAKVSIVGAVTRVYRKPEGWRVAILANQRDTAEKSSAFFWRGPMNFTRVPGRNAFER